MIRFLLPFKFQLPLMKLVIIFLFFESSYANSREEMIKCFNKYTSYYSELYNYTRLNCNIILRSENKPLRKRAKCILKKLKRAKTPEDAGTAIKKCLEEFRKSQN